MRDTHPVNIVTLNRRVKMTRSLWLVLVVALMLGCGETDNPSQAEIESGKGMVLATSHSARQLTRTVYSGICLSDNHQVHIPEIDSTDMPLISIYVNPIFTADVMVECPFTITNDYEAYVHVYSKSVWIVNANTRPFRIVVIK